MSKNKTAVEFLVSEVRLIYTTTCKMPDLYDKIRLAVEQAKQMEKEQMIDFTDNYVDNCVIPNENMAIPTTMDVPTYYTQTYESDNTQIYQAFKGELIQDENGNLKPKTDEQ